MIDLTCKWCGSEFVGKKSREKYCSRNCGNLAKSLAMKQMERTPEHGRKISVSLRGQKFSEERLKNMSAGRIGKMTGSDHWNWNNDRREVETRKKLRSIMRGALRHTLTHARCGKIGKTEELLGYDPQKLRTHLESFFEPGMNWENYGYGSDKWNVDHIRPVSRWPKDASVMEVNALVNLRPMWQPENLKKGNSWNE